jgi:2-polyprenyl-6-methoxyphenol hydroxylase-like FAD-dependent oxidoreductase
MAPTKIAIVGAGLGGLAAALFLRRAGLEVAVYEQSAAFQELGAGIVVPPNMVRPLRRLGLAKTLDEFAVRLEFAWEFRRWQDGRLISTTPMGERCELMYGAPCYVAHRADLREFLRSALPGETVRLDRRCIGVTQSRKGVVLEFVSASGRMLHVEADAAIGADGIHSIIRDSVTTQEEPRFSGLCAFRCLVPADRAPEMARRPVHTLWLGPGRHFVHYPISAGRLINIVAIAPAGDWRSESWTADGEISDLAREFGQWDGRVHQLILSATQTKRWALFDRAPLEQWTAGRVSLLGDAAHAMLPFLAQGAAQCVEDAVTLADCLKSAEPGTIETALKRYEELRRPRANHVLLMSRGREIQNHFLDGPEQELRDRKLAAGPA